jgi:hypothetical protein
MACCLEVFGGDSEDVEVVVALQRFELGEKRLDAT